MTARAAIAIAASGTLAACSIGPVDLTGKQCPCADGWTCDTTTNTCVGGPPDARGAPDATTDGPADAPPVIADARVDAVPGTTCLGASGVELLADDFPDLIGWTTINGTWTAAGAEAVESATPSITYAFPAGTGAFVDYRVTTTARKTGGSGSIAAMLRLQPGNDGQYACTWNPNTGQLAWIWTRTNGNNGGTLTSMTIDTSGIPGYDPLAPITIEAQAAGSALACCIREVPGALVSTTDTRYTLGSPGVRTNTAAGAFAQFRVNAP